jgi:prevent-host-death family protein
MVMFKVNLFEAKAKLSEYVDRAARGERIVICRHNKPVAELRSIAEARTNPRVIGPIPGRPTFDLPPSFFAPMPPDELDLWDGISATDPLAAKPQPVSRAHAAGVAERAAVPGGSRRARAPRRRT